MTPDALDGPYPRPYRIDEGAVAAAQLYAVINAGLFTVTSLACAVLAVLAEHGRVYLIGVAFATAAAAATHVIGWTLLARARRPRTPRR